MLSEAIIFCPNVFGCYMIFWLKIRSLFYFKHLKKAESLKEANCL